MKSLKKNSIQYETESRIINISRNETDAKMGAATQPTQNSTAMHTPRGTLINSHPQIEVLNEEFEGLIDEFKEKQTPETSNLTKKKGRKKTARTNSRYSFANKK